MTIQLTNSFDINTIFNELLGRDAKSEGKSYWTDQYNKGQSIQSIKDNIKLSPEYKTNNPTTNLTYKASSDPNLSISDPYANDPNYTTTPTGIGPFQQVTVSGSPSSTTQTWNKDEGKWDITTTAGEDKTYYKTGSSSTGETINIDAFLPNQYSGPIVDIYETGISDPNLRWDKGSKNDRAAENIYQQNKIDELIKYVQAAGLGNFSLSEGSTPQWMPTGDRNQENRLAEDKWQQSQIADLQKWAADFVAAQQPYVPPEGSSEIYLTDADGNRKTNPYANLTFTPGEAFSNFDSIHTNVNKDRNLAQSSDIDSLVEFITQLDIARAPGIDKQRDTMSGIYGAEIDKIFGELFETDNPDSEFFEKTIDQAGKDYWIKDLIDNRPGLSKGQDWTNWLQDAFKNTESYKDFLANKPPESLIDEIETIDVGGGTYTGGGSSSSSSSSTDYASMLEAAKAEWDLGLTDQLTSLSEGYTSQINDLKDMFALTQKSNADLLKGYQDQVASYQKAQESQAAYGERPMNQTVKGVKTKNELPGYKPSTGGTTGHFSRTGDRLSTKSLNVA
jgi:hypothetical protein